MSDRSETNEKHQLANQKEMMKSGKIEEVKQFDGLVEDIDLEYEKVSSSNVSSQTKPAITFKTSIIRYEDGNGKG